MATFTHLLCVGLVHLPPILACQGTPGLDGVCASYVDDRFEHRVPATQNHLPNVVEAMYSDSIRLFCLRDVCATYSALQNCFQKWPSGAF